MPPLHAHRSTEAALWRSHRDLVAEPGLEVDGATDYSGCGGADLERRWIKFDLSGRSGGIVGSTVTC